MQQLVDWWLKVSLALLRRFANLPRYSKRVIVFLIDIVLLQQSIWITYSLRLGVWILWDDAILKVTAGAIALMVPIFVFGGVYQTIFRYAGAGLMRTLLRAFFIYGTAMVAIFSVYSFVGVPRTLGVLQPIVFFLMVGASRIIIRSLLVDYLGRGTFGGKIQRVLIYGAGNQGQQIAASMRTDPAMRVVGYVDDDTRLNGQKLDGIKVHSSARLSSVVKDLEVSDILLALPNIGRRRRSDIVHELENLGVTVNTLPPVRELIEGKATISDIRPLDIEDLLGREPVRPNELLLGRTIVGKSVFVSGAGGSIGSELCRQILRAGARRLVLFEQSEFALYAIERELSRLASSEGLAVDLRPVLGSVLDTAAIEAAIRVNAVQTVYHAAAYKHVPLVEANPLVAIRNNVVGTFEAVQAAVNAGVADFVLISTDKAVRPTNVMGATKRSAEQVLQAYSGQHPGMRCSMVRFGNVLGSSGSVVPLFRRQIEQGGPVTITHREVTRYFMTIPEAASLVLQAAGLAKGGEVFVLDMGEQMKIIDLARTMILLSGLTVRDADHPNGDIELAEIGLRPGEKLYEELLIGNSPRPTAHPRIMMAREGHLGWAEVHAILGELRTCDDEGEAIGLLQRLVPEFDHRRDDLGNSELAELQSNS